MKHKHSEISPILILINFSFISMFRGLGYGALLGTTYGWLVIVYWSIADELFGGLMFLLIGSVYGGVIGGFVGAPMGFFMGAVMGFVTIFLRGAIYRRYYRWLMMAVGVVSVIIGAIQIVSWLEISSGDLMSEGIAFFIIPTIIAMLAAAHASNQMVNWWQEESYDKKKKRGET